MAHSFGPVIFHVWQSCAWQTCALARVGDELLQSGDQSIDTCSVVIRQHAFAGCNRHALPQRIVGEQPRHGMCHAIRIVRRGQKAVDTVDNLFAVPAGVRGDERRAGRQRFEVGCAKIFGHGRVQVNIGPRYQPRSSLPKTSPRNSRCKRRAAARRDNLAFQGPSPRTTSLAAGNFA